MIIGIDAKALTIKYPCGLKTYAYELILHLAKIDQRNTYYIFSPQPVSIPHKHNFRNIYPPQNVRFLPWQLLMPILLLQHPTTIFHFLNYHGSVFLWHPKIITTIHDWARSSDYPTIVQNLKYGLMNYYVQLVRTITCAKTRFFICDSRFTRRELHKHFSANTPSAVVYLASTKTFNRRIAKSDQRRLVLLFADFSPRKNTVRALEAYTQLPHSIKKMYPLHIVCSMKDPLPMLNQTLIRLNVTNFVNIKVGYSTNQLNHMYNQSAVLLYPSLHEGFGLPILEAMSHGCPVITANGSATKEVAGKAALLVNPTSIPELHGALFDILTQSGLRQKLQKKGLERSLQFSWEKTARLTLLLYEKSARL